jgi:PAS domain S-box-containing protein
VLFEHNPQPMWVFDLQSLRFLAVNDAAIRQYGYSRREFLLLTILDIRPPSDISHVLRSMAVTRSGNQVHGTWRHHGKSGEPFDVEVFWTTVRFQGRDAQLVVAIDNSRRIQAERGLKKLRDALERRVTDRTAALERAIGELGDEIRERKRLAVEIVRVQEVERRKLARELHDEVGQTLTGLKLILQTIPRLDTTSERIIWAEALVDGLMRQIRELSVNLRPSVLDDLGLLAALLWHIERYTAQTGVRVAFTHVGIDQRLPADVEIAAFRIVQEALTNVARHAGVRDARLWARRDPRELSVIVEDDGRGMAAQGRGSDASGLTGMRERATLLGGELLVDVIETGGTRVTAILPLRPSDDGAPAAPAVRP